MQRIKRNTIPPGFSPLIEINRQLIDIKTDQIYQTANPIEAIQQLRDIVWNCECLLDSVVDDLAAAVEIVEEVPKEKTQQEKLE